MKLKFGQNYQITEVVQPGEVHIILAPHSEVCMYMGIAGKLMLAEYIVRTYPPIEGNDRPYISRCVQLYKTDGTPFSSPVTYGEAGFFYNHEEDILYFYPPLVENVPA